MDNHLLGKTILEGGVPEGFKEVNTNFFQFKTIGDTISGRLIVKGKQKAGNSEVGRYTIIDGNNKTVSFMGSTDLDEKLALVTLRNDIIVTYETDLKTSTDPAKNNMKIFKVFARHAGDKLET